MIRVGRPKKLTYEMLGEAIISIGLDNVTFNKLADYLHVGQATVYRYLPNQTALAACACDYVFSDVTWEHKDTWQETIYTACLQLYDILSEHPHLSLALENSRWTEVTIKKVASLTKMIQQHVGDELSGAVITDAILGLVVHYHSAMETRGHTDSSLYNHEQLVQRLRDRYGGKPENDHIIDLYSDDPIRIVLRQTACWMIDGITAQLERGESLALKPHCGHNGTSAPITD